MVKAAKVSAGYVGVTYIPTQLGKQQQCACGAEFDIVRVGEHR